MKATIIVYLQILATFVLDGTAAFGGPANYVFVIDESTSFRNRNYHHIGRYRNFTAFFVRHFDVGYTKNQTRVAVLCTGYPNGGGIFEFSVKNADLMKTDTFGCNYEGKYLFKDDLHERFKSYILPRFSKNIWTNDENITIVFTDGHLTDEEAIFPNESEVLRSSNNLFFIYVRDHGKPNKTEIGRMVNWTLSEQRVIDFDELLNDPAILFRAMCNSGVMNAARKKTCNYESYEYSKSWVAETTTMVESSDDGGATKGQSTETKDIDKTNERSQEGKGGESSYSSTGMVIGIVCGMLVMLLIIVAIVVVVVVRGREAKKVAKKYGNLEKAKTVGESSVRRSERGRGVFADINATTTRNAMQKRTSKKGSKSTTSAQVKSAKSSNPFSKKSAVSKKKTTKN